jgi:hypothetical protein
MTPTAIPSTVRQRTATNGVYHQNEQNPVKNSHQVTAARKQRDIEPSAPDSTEKFCISTECHQRIRGFVPARVTISQPQLKSPKF